MSRRVVCVTLASLSLVFLMALSCAPPSSTTVPTATSVPPTTTPAASGVPATTPVTEVPKYGGSIVVATLADPNGFDPGVISSLLTTSVQMTNEYLLQADWAKGPAGTGQTDWRMGPLGRVDILTGMLAESWELPDKETIIFHIRKGIHWHNKPPMNGREFTAEDAAWSLNREWANPKAYFQSNNVKEDWPISIKALDKYTLELKVPATVQGLHLNIEGLRGPIMPREVVEKFGDMQDWRNSSGTGPWTLTDFVSGSSLTYVRNADYWMKDPVGSGKGNQLPYADGVKVLIIPDPSTTLAAFRTGKISYLPARALEDFTELSKANPQLKYNEVLGETYIPVGREDKADLPFKDLRVRQAMNLAVDQPGILKNYYQGRGQLLGWPFYDTPAHRDLYMPLKDMPQNVQELFTYNPDKAKKLAEAGYPNGFKTNIVCRNVDVDVVSIVKEQLAKVGIDMEIKVLETGVFTSVNRGRTQDQMLYKETKMYFNPWKMAEVRKESFDNLAYFEAPETRAVYNQVNLYVGKDDSKWMKLIKDITPFMLEQSWGIWMPVSYKYTMWWPWVKNFNGEQQMSFAKPFEFTQYVWIDQAMKKSLGY
jgi:peptide/nickel transport system substrate-binding protein